MTDFRAQMLSNVKLRERSILKNVYLWMTAGLALTAVVAYLISASNIVITPTVMFIAIIAEFALVVYLSARLQKMSTLAAVLAFTVYAMLNGVTLSIIFYVYGRLTISRAFFTTAALFGGMSLYGMTTKRQLDGIGHYLVMGLWGIIIASLINMFFRSESVYYFISIIGVLVFVGLTAWDTQKIKRLNDAYSGHMDEDTFVKLSIIGALTLYLDFLNIFLYLLRIFGRSDR
ncbi:MAG: Bax inhibitor-1/YccA family protein [Sphaerochaetaceae bacterium]|jgi:FtsH-binding integral membrane protein|nr:Bax inhibitor-1/YccA family protein [Sphaerochaetaceae bacterium]MDX9809405.1 Bax inhibitor-1/YccA family protein [Sphaerochaetaceae bacterium]NLV83590.1 Bax inhibitor-1/YccA family protein [Spirochaetales bacterium]